MKSESERIVRTRTLDFSNIHFPSFRPLNDRPSSRWPGRLHPIAPRTCEIQNLLQADDKIKELQHQHHDFSWL